MTTGCTVDGSEMPTRQVEIDRYPNECPTCHVTIEPANVGLNPFSNTQWLEFYSRCTNQKCRRFFISIYELDRGRSQGSAYYFRFLGSLPWNRIERSFSKTITDISPLFAQIYNQAKAAESQKMFDVAGPGFRKALEFLLKDYAIKLHPNDAGWIRRAQLAQVISKYFTEPRMSVVFSRATWLGNDQTHYERRWIDHDIDHLKRLIDASVHFIEMERLASELPTDMPNPNQT
jgi:hypothetical protein